MQNSAIEREVLGLENRFWKAMRESDVDTALSLTRFPCIVTGPKGAMRVDEAQFKSMMKAGNPEQFKGVEIEAPQVEVVNERTAIITYTIHMDGMKMLDTSTWVKNEGDRWLCALHSETPELKDMPKQ